MPETTSVPAGLTMSKTNIQNGTSIDSLKAFVNKKKRTTNNKRYFALIFSFFFFNTFLLTSHKSKPSIFFHVKSCHLQLLPKSELSWK